MTRIRLSKAQRGLLGDIAPVGEGVFEMREFLGPGWRMYFVQRGDVLLVMLGCGDKSTQKLTLQLRLPCPKLFRSESP
ncbi:type II toxin-antitoxin system RelE/ParE family toxin [Rhodoferax sp.]|uniref:type II toxin-antitoxin system RelE/ParE family toxin n=1 Tax=Rhodoferax sp. TaxID=50421 RepID=UPI00262F3D8D|nr:type II toxin-antitoxin system RelE/ParE family toxin [Rhodoferax sp.]MDD5480670.1 type II toxin-antitoxin system RelE/ParE family toxin [Rhodoferax sp.]